MNHTNEPITTPAPRQSCSGALTWTAAAFSFCAKNGGRCEVTPENVEPAPPPRSHAACKAASDGHDDWTLYQVTDRLGCEVDALTRYTKGYHTAARRRVFDEDGDAERGLAGPPEAYRAEIATLAVSVAEDLHTGRRILEETSRLHRVALEALCDDGLITRETLNATRVSLGGVVNRHAGNGALWDAWNAADLLARVADSTDRVLNRRLTAPGSGNPQEDWIEVHACIADARTYLRSLVDLLDHLPSPAAHAEAL